MGIFSRMKDIMNSNINAMLDRAEDPEKLLRLMIQEMEDTLVEIKAQCAGAMAQSKTLGRRQAEFQAKAQDWADKARLALSRSREDLAREALVEKRRFQDKAEALNSQKSDFDAMVDQYQRDIAELESKIVAVREKQKSLLQRHTQARTRRRAQESIRKFDTSDVMARFESFERRVDHMESEADLVNFGRKESLDEKIAALGADDDIEKELNSLRDEMRQPGGPTPGSGL